MKFAAAVIAFLLLSSAAAGAAIQSVSRIAFGPANVLFAADWRAGRVYAYRLNKARTTAVQPFNLKNLQVPFARAAGTPHFRIRDLVMRPGSGEAYVALETEPRHRPVIVRVSPSGDVAALDLVNTPSVSAALQQAGGELTFWDSIPERSFTVTDMKWHRGKLYVAGLANARFSSTLRVLSYPFATQSLTSIEIYHTVHDQIETRAPIRAMAFADVGGVDTLLAGYLCSPLVAIPVASLVDGKHVRAKTLTELGVAGVPSSMVVYDQPDMRSGHSYPFLLVNERYRPSVAIPLAGLAKVDAGKGITSPPSLIAPAGANVGAIAQGLDGVVALDNQDRTFFVALRRDLDTGAPQVVSYDKRALFRLSDADISDYDFPDYSYRGTYQRKMILPMQNMLKSEEGYPDLVIPAKP